MNATNLQVASLCLALDSICRTLVNNGIVQRQAPTDALAQPEASALSEPRALTDANQDAICFLIRVLRAGLDSPQGTSDFATLATQVGRDKPDRRGENDGSRAMPWLPLITSPRRNTSWPPAPSRPSDMHEWQPLGL